MLRITKASDPITVERLVACIYSPPGEGKTTLAFTAEKPLLLDFDNGVHRAGMRQDAVLVNTWDDVAQITGDDLKAYKTLVIDTAGRALDVLTADIITKNPKFGRSGGALTLQGFGELKSRFITFTKLVRSFGLDIVLLAHCDEQKDGDEVRERIDVQGGSKNEVYKVADIMGRLYIKGNQRYLNFNPSETSFGKNPGQLPELKVPHFTENSHFLADLISQVKSTLNKLTAEQQEAANVLVDWQARFESAATADELNKFGEEIGKMDEDIKKNVARLWLKVGKSHGWTQDKATKLFVEAKAA